MPDCAVHTQVPDQECDFCQAEMTQKTNNLQALANQTTKLAQEIESKGMHLDSAVALDIKISLIVQAIFDPRSQIALEVAFHHRLQEVLKQVLSQAQRSSLVVPGVAPMPKMRRAR